MVRTSERTMTAVAVGGLVAALALAGQVRTPPGGDDWTDGAAGAWLWLLVGLVPVVVAGVTCAVMRRGRRGTLLPLGMAMCLVLSTVVGSLLHVEDLGIDRRVIAGIGGGLDVAAVVMMACIVATLVRPKLARGVTGATTIVGVTAALAFTIAVTPTAEARIQPTVSPLQVPSLSFLGDVGEAVLICLALGPVIAIALLVWTLVGATLDERRRVRWLALSAITGAGIVAGMQLVRLLGLIDVGDGFLAALPRAVAWAAVAAGIAATIAQPDLGDAAIAVRKVAVGVSLVTILAAAGGLAWFAADATTSPIVPGAPAAAAVLTVAALFLPVRERLEHAADRWLFGEIGSDARLIDAFGAAVEHAGPTDVLDQLVTTARRGLGLRWANASAPRFTAHVATVGSTNGKSAANSATIALMEGGEQLGELCCGPKRSGPLNTHDRQLLGALGREAALRLRTASQADELAARLVQIETQAAEIAASRTRIVEAQDEERRRIERDIHDGVQQELASLIGKLRLALNQLERSPADASATIASAQDDVRRTLADVRAIAQGIHPAILDDQGIARAIDARAKRLPLEVTVDAAPELMSRRFDRTIEGAAYYVASEALANVVKHANATAVEVHLGLDGDRLTIRVSDDGRGFDERSGRGNGLTNMSDRAAALGGRVTIETNASGGATVAAELPVAPTVAV